MNNQNIQTNQHDVEIEKMKLEKELKNAELNRNSFSNQSDVEISRVNLEMKKLEMELQKLKITSGDQEARDQQKVSGNKMRIILIASLFVVIVAGVISYFNTVGSIKAAGNAIVEAKKVDTEVEKLKILGGSQESREQQQHELDMKKVDQHVQLEIVALEKERMRAAAELEEQRIKARETYRKEQIKAREDRIKREKEVRDYQILNSIGN